MGSRGCERAKITGRGRLAAIPGFKEKRIQGFDIIFIACMKLNQLAIMLLTCLGLICFSYCQKEAGREADAGPAFDSIPVVKPITPIINEISGISDSKTYPGFLWGHEDSGRPPQLYKIGHDGQVSKKVYIKGVTNRDWEDMDLADNKIYIGEIGDNASAYSNYKFYLFTEPAASLDTVSQVETISFTYPDGSHDAEAFVVDPLTKDIYVITKRDDPSRVYKLVYPYSASSTVSYEGSLPYMGVTGAAISADGKEIIVKTYTNLFHYKRKTGQSVAQALQSAFTTLKYTIEPQGEAISFAANGSGFFTVSEKGFAPWVNIYFYKKK